jgi:hypothetical protein
MNALLPDWSRAKPLPSEGGQNILTDFDHSTCTQSKLAEMLWSETSREELGKTAMDSSATVAPPHLVMFARHSGTAAMVTEFEKIFQHFAF